MMSDSEQFSNRFELDLISLLVNFSCELGQIMTIYDFPLVDVFTVVVVTGVLFRVTVLKIVLGIKRDDC